MSSWHKYGGIGHDSKFKNLMSNNLASNEIAKMNKLYANNICVAHDVDVSGNVYVDGSVDISGNLDLCGNAVIDGTLDVSGHSQLCDVSACNVDISGNLDLCGNAVIDGTLDVSGHSQLCDVSACNVDISQNLRAGIQQFAVSELRGAGEILNPRIYVDIDDEEKSDVIVGSGNFFAFTGVSDSSHNSVFGNFIRHTNSLHDHITSESIFMGDGCGRNDTIVTKYPPEIIRCGIFLGAKAKSGELGAGATSTNEIVIGCNTTGNGSNTAQIGNCDTTDVYLGCDGSGTTLHVDNIICHNIDGSGGDTHTVCDLSACNIDISQNLKVDGSVNFTNARKIFMDQGNIILDEQGQIGIGFDALKQPRNEARNNIAIGQEALKDCSGNNCIDNVAIGSSALKNASGNTNQNVVIGFKAGQELSASSSDNVLIGRDCGAMATDASLNDISGCVGIGERAIWDVSGNFNCISIGSQNNNTLTYGSANEIVIGCDASGNGSDTVQIGNDDISAVYLGKEITNASGANPFTLGGVRLYTKELQYYDRNIVVDTDTVLGFDDLFIRNYGIKNPNTNVFVYPQTDICGTIISPNKMPGDYDFNVEGQSIVLNFYRVDWSSPDAFSVYINGGIPSDNTFNYGTPKRIVFPGTTNSSPECLTLIWDGSGAWSILHASNVNVYTT